MKKKLLFGILLISLFLFSTISAVQPARGYEFGVPDQAKGMEGESEIKIYDKDEWKDHLGSDADRPGSIWEGDADVVGAKSKGKVIDWEEDEELISFFWDHVLEASLDLDYAYSCVEDPLVGSYKDAISYINRTLTGYLYTGDGVYLTQGMEGLIEVLNGINIGYFDGGFGGPSWGIITNATIQSWLAMCQNTLANFMQGTLTEDQAKALFDKEYDGTYITTDNWDFYENADYPSKPDDKNVEGPFLADPRDLRDSYDSLVALKNMIYGQLNAYAKNGSTLYAMMHPSVYGDPGNASWVNQILIAQLYGSPVLLGHDPTYGALNQTLEAGAGGPEKIIEQFENVIPKKAGYLYLALEGGIPVYTPTGDYLKKMVEEFDIDDEDVETGHPAMDGIVPFTCDVEVEGMVITMEFEMDDYLDPADWEVDCDLLVAKALEDRDELEDWEVVFTYSEYGSQSKIQYMDGDDIFFEKGGVDQIPGYEVVILIGVSALSVLGLIYVIMKKRKM